MYNSIEDLTVNTRKHIDSYYRYVESAGAGSRPVWERILARAQNNSNQAMRLMQDIMHSRASMNPMHTQAISFEVSSVLNSGVRCFANDNVAKFLEPGDREAIIDEVAERMMLVLQALIIDVENDHNAKDTARRYAKMLVTEWFSGRYDAPPSITTFPNDKKTSSMIVYGPIHINSACSHHLVPITGTVFVAVLPNEDSRLPGLSKYERVIHHVARRPQIQEEMAEQMADAISDTVCSDNVAVVVKARHMCCSSRGVRNPNGVMTTPVLRGSFIKPEVRAELFHHITESTR